MIAAAPRRRSLSVLFCLGSPLFLTASRAEDAAPAEAAVGFILPGAPAGCQGPELQGALKLARKLGPAAVIVPGGCGDFAGEQGGAISLDGFRVIWCHQGDSIDDTGPVHDKRTVETIRRFVSAGGGRFLSGAALAMVEALGIEPAKPRRGAPGNDRIPAALVPLDADHPIFGGLAFDGRLVREPTDADGVLRARRVQGRSLGAMPAPFARKPPPAIPGREDPKGGRGARLR